MSKGDTRLILARDIDIDQPEFVNMQNDNVMNDTRMVHASPGVQILMDTTRIDDAAVVYESTTIDVHEWNAVWIGLLVQSTLAPTTVQFIPTFSYGGETGTRYRFLEGLWASMFYEDVDTAAGIAHTWLLPCGGAYFLRFQVIGVGVNAGAYFTVRIVAQPFRGNFVAAHA